MLVCNSSSFIFLIVLVIARIQPADVQNFGIGKIISKSLKAFENGKSENTIEVPASSMTGQANENTGPSAKSNNTSRKPMKYWPLKPPENRWSKVSFENFTQDGILSFHDNATESDIKEILRTVYDETSRPVSNDSTTVKVTVAFSLYNILDTNEKFHTISTLLSIRLRWVDNFLRWKSNRVKSLYIPADRIWVPDIVFANSAEATNGYITTNAIVQSNGSVLWMFPILLKSQCIFQVFFFPFDCQKCKIVLISWTYSGRQVDLKPDPTDDNEIYYNHRNQEWYVDKINVSRNIVVYECCPNDTFPDVTFTIYMRRRSQFYVLNLIYPCLLFYILSFLGFLLPLESGDKVNMEVTVLLSLVVFMMFVNEMLPPTADMLPAIGMIVVTTMIEVVMALMMAVAVTYLAHYNLRPEKIPRIFAWILEHYGSEKIVRKFKQALLVKHFCEPRGAVKATVQKKTSPVFAQKPLPVVSSPQKRPSLADCTTLFFRNNKQESKKQKPRRSAMTTTMTKIPVRNYVMSPGIESSSSDDEACETVTNVLLSTNRRNRHRRYWIEIARILDRVFLVIFGICSGCINLFLYLIMLADDTPFDIFTTTKYDS